MSAEEVEYRSGEVIFRQGEPGGYFLLIKSGSVEIYSESKDGEAPLAIQGEGEIVGLLTFFGDENRHASARARSLVRGQIVRKSSALKDGQLPGWVGIVLKEFSARLGQMNKLYARAYVRQEKMIARIIDPLFIAAQVADSMSVIGRHYSKKAADGREMIVLSVLANALQEMLGHELGEIQRTFKVFKNFGLIKVELDPDSNAEVTSVKGTGRLKWFTQYVQAARSGKARKQMEAKIPFKHRRVLFGLRDFAQKEGLELSKPVRVSMDDLAGKFETHTKFKLLPEALKQAEEVDLLKLVVQGQKTTVEYHPFDLARTIICMNVIHRLRSDSEDFED